MNRAERLIIWNQLELLKHQNPANRSQFDLQQDIVASGFSALYDRVFGPVLEEEASVEMQAEVYTILDMFRSLNNAMTRGWEPSDPTAASFAGFDGNNGDHYLFADMLLGKLNMYAESAPNKNSHSSGTLSRYRRMLEVWQKQGKDRFDLTGAQAEAVIKA